MTEENTLTQNKSSRFLKYINKNYFTKWVIIGLLIGIVAGFGATIFYLLIALVTNSFLGTITGFHPPSPAGEAASLANIANPKYYLIPVVTMIGGLIAGVLVFTLAPEAEGHGTDAAIDAFHNKGGVIRKRIPLVKMIASAFTIGTGGSAGREGPTAQIAAGFGSILGDVFKLSASDRRIALAAGIGAGIGSIFNDFLRSVSPEEIQSVSNDSLCELDSVVVALLVDTERTRSDPDFVCLKISSILVNSCISNVHDLPLRL